MPTGALLNIPISQFLEPSGFVSINGTYTFVARFFTTNTNNLTGSLNYPQNQVIVLSNLSSPTTIQVQVGHGNYTISNVTLKLFNNDKVVLTQNLNNISIACLAPCSVTPTPTSIVPLSQVQYQVSHQSGSLTSIAWELEAGLAIIAQGVANNIVNSSSFVINTPVLNTVLHALTLKGVSCVGENTITFTPEGGGITQNPPVYTLPTITNGTQSLGVIQGSNYLTLALNAQGQLTDTFPDVMNGSLRQNTIGGVLSNVYYQVNGSNLLNINNTVLPPSNIPYQIDKYYMRADEFPTVTEFNNSYQTRLPGKNTMLAKAELIWQ